VYYDLILELMSDMLGQRPEEDTSLDNIIVVDNAPIVGPDRLSKLKAVLKKIFQRFGDIVTEFYPVNENDETKGYVVILCETFVINLPGTFLLRIRQLDEPLVWVLVYVHGLFSRLYTVHMYNGLDSQYVYLY